MPTANMTLGAVAALTLFFVAPTSDAPRFVCKEGVTVKRTLAMKSKRELTKFTIRTGDSSLDHKDIHRTRQAGSKQVVRDEVRACADGEVTQLARTYETLERTSSEHIQAPDGENTIDMPETSELLAKTVVFTRADDMKSWKRTIEAGAADELTADLEADMDYRVLLPDGNAQAGAQWDVDFAAAKTALLHPGGDLPFHGKDEPKSMDKRLRKLAWDATKGKLSLELGTPRDEDGRKLVDIQFKGDMSYDASTTPQGDEQGPRSVRVEDAQKLEGKLVWNLDAGRAQSIEWTSKGRLALTVGGTAKQKDGTDVEAEQIQAFDEEYAYTGAFEGH
jgi:hypothetical protein